MIIPAEHHKHHGKIAGNQNNNFPTAKHLPENTPAEGEHILLKDSPDASDWYCAQTEEVLEDRIKASCHTATTPPISQF